MTCLALAQYLSTQALRRHNSSNYGKPIHCCTWVGNVTTLDLNHDILCDYRGTSAAYAIIAGAAALLQPIVMCNPIHPPSRHVGATRKVDDRREPAHTLYSRQLVKLFTKWCGMKSQGRRRFLLVAYFILIALTACAPSPQFAVADVVGAMSGPADERFARAYAPVEFTFPLDHGPHPEYRTEWWYYTGNLEDDAGRRYGYQLTFFRSALTPEQPERDSALATNQIYMAHFALTDVAGQRHQSFERYSRGAGDLAGATGEPAYAVWLEDWSVQTVALGVTRVQARATGDDGVVALDLLLGETREPILHGDRGLSAKGPEPGNASYYYSLVQLETTGAVTVAGRTVDVQGVSWMDHEFGTSALSGDAVGWDWFSVQLDIGAVLMFAQVRNRDGSVTQEFEGTLVDAAGQQATIHAHELRLTPLGQWTSPRTGFRYPSGWQIEMPVHGVELTVTPLVNDQEMMVSFIYWEGAVEVTGSMAGDTVQGVGYVELTGYGDGAGGHQR